MTNKNCLKLIEDDIKRTISKLYSLNFIRDQNDIKREAGSNNELMLSYKRKFGSTNYLYDNNINYATIIDKLLEQRDYTLLLYDKSIIQYEFIIKDGVIIKERLLFIKKHNKIWPKDELNKFDGDDEDWFNDNLGFPIVIRIDYDSKNAKPITHPDVHFTLSNHESCRIPVKSIMQVSEFIQFILFTFYNQQIEIEKKHTYPLTIKSEEKRMIHINWE